MSNSFMLVVDGTDGAGKSTQIEKLAKFYKKKGYDVVLTKEPGGTDLSADLRGIFKKEYKEIIDIKTELMILASSRLQNLKNVIEPALKKENTVVICDRWSPSTYAYQLIGASENKKEEQELIEFYQLLEKETLKGFNPDQIILLTANPKTALERIESRGEGLDRIESKGMEYLSGVYNNFLNFNKIAKEYFPELDINNVDTSNLSIDEVFAEIITSLNKKKEITSEINFR